MKGDAGGSGTIPTDSGTASPRPPRPRPGGRGNSSLIVIGSSFDTIYIVPLTGSAAGLPQLAPPLFPGISIVPIRLGGVNNPSFREVINRSRNAACSASG